MTYNGHDPCLATTLFGHGQADFGNLKLADLGRFWLGGTNGHGRLWPNRLWPILVFSVLAKFSGVVVVVVVLCVVVVLSCVVVLNQRPKP